MVSDSTRKQVWYSLLSAVHQSRYYEKTANRMLKWKRVRNGVHAALAAGAATAFITDVTHWIAIVANFLVVVFSVYSILEDHSQKLTIVRGVGNRCHEVEIKMRALWLEIQNGNLETATAERRWYDLEQELSHATESSGTIDVDDSLSEAIAKEAVDLITEELA